MLYTFQRSLFSQTGKKVPLKICVLFLLLLFYRIIATPILDFKTCGSAKKEKKRERERRREREGERGKEIEFAKNEKLCLKLQIK